MVGGGRRVLPGATAVVALLGVGVSTAAGGAGANPYAAPAGRVSNAHPLTVNPVGTWHYCQPGSGCFATWTFSSGGGWSDSLGDTGLWIQQGKAVSVDIQSGPGIAFGPCFFLGKLITTSTTHTLNTFKVPGPRYCGGGNSTWYAHQ